MRHTPRKPRLNHRMPWLFSLAFSALAAASPALAGGESLPGLQVQAQSTVKIAPDRATVRARLWEETPAADLRETAQRKKHEDARRQARKALEQRATELITALENAGLEHDAVSAGSLSVHPRRETAPAERQKDAPRLTRTRFERPVSVELKELDRLEDVLNALMTAGVNRLDGVTFDLEDRQAATDEALVKALEKARHKARRMADVLDIRLGPVLAVQETRSPNYSPRTMRASAEARGKAESAMPETAYRPGTVDIQAGVSVKWALSAAPDASKPTD
ncbi:SIMPL domain-containing protein [Halomonas cibimaris]